MFKLYMEYHPGLQETITGGILPTLIDSKDNTIAGSDTSSLENERLTAFGRSSGGEQTMESVFLGYQAGNNATECSQITAIGYQSGMFLRGDGHCLVGTNTGMSLSPQSKNMTVVGAQASQYMTSSGDDSVIIGALACQELDGRVSRSVVAGADACKNVVGDITESVCLGPEIGVSADTIRQSVLIGSMVPITSAINSCVLGETQANTPLSNCVLIGQGVCANTQNDLLESTVAVGARALIHANVLDSITVIGTDIGSFFDGGQSTLIGTAGTANALSGVYNTLLGANTCSTGNVDGKYNVICGNDNFKLPFTLSNCVVVGHQITFDRFQVLNRYGLSNLETLLGFSAEIPRIGTPGGDTGAPLPASRFLNYIFLPETTTVSVNGTPTSFLVNGPVAIHSATYSPLLPIAELVFEAPSSKYLDPSRIRVNDEDVEGFAGDFYVQLYPVSQQDVIVSIDDDGYFQSSLTPSSGLVILFKSIHPENYSHKNLHIYFDGVQLSYQANVNVVYTGNNRMYTLRMMEQTLTFEDSIEVIVFPITFPVTRATVPGDVQPFQTTISMAGRQTTLTMGQVFTHVDYYKGIGGGFPVYKGSGTGTIQVKYQGSSDFVQANSIPSVAQIAPQPFIVPKRRNGPLQLAARNNTFYMQDSPRRLSKASFDLGNPNGAFDEGLSVEGGFSWSAPGLFGLEVCATTPFVGTTTGIESPGNGVLVVISKSVEQPTSLRVYMQGLAQPLYYVSSNDLFATTSGYFSIEGDAQWVYVSLRYDGNQTWYITLEAYTGRSYDGSKVILQTIDLYFTSPSSPLFLANIQPDEFIATLWTLSLDDTTSPNPIDPTYDRFLEFVLVNWYVWTDVEIQKLSNAVILGSQYRISSADNESLAVGAAGERLLRVGKTQASFFYGSNLSIDHLSCQSNSTQATWISAASSLPTHYTAPPGLWTRQLVVGNVQTPLDGKLVVGPDALSNVGLICNHVLNTGANAIALRINTQSTIVVSQTGVQYLTNSDERLKDSIQPVASSNVMDIIMKFRPVSYKYIGSNERREGFVAEEIIKVFPECVVKHGPLPSVDMTKLIPLLAAAVANLDNNT